MDEAGTHHWASHHSSKRNAEKWMLIWSRAKVAVGAGMINTQYLLGKTANPALIFLLLNRNQLPQLKKKKSLATFPESHTTRGKDFSATLSTQQNWQPESTVLWKCFCYVLMSAQFEGGRASKYELWFAPMIPQQSWYFRSPEVALELQCRSGSCGTFLIKSYFLLLSCLSHTPKPASPASVTEAAGSCHCGDLIWRKPVSRGSYNWGSLQAFGSHPVWCMPARMDTCTILKFIFSASKIISLSLKDVCLGWPEFFLLASLNIPCFILSPTPLAQASINMVYGTSAPWLFKDFFSRTLQALVN